MIDKFSLLAGIASDWWWEMDAELRFTFFSERFTEVFGLSPTVALGKRRTDIDRTDYGSPVWPTHLDYLANRLPFRDFETTFVDAMGVPRPVSISATPLFAIDGTFTGYIGVGHDLTELRRQEKEASAQAANLESILENIEQGVVLLDGEPRIVAYNRRLAELLQFDADRDLRGMPYETIVREFAERGEYAPEDKEAAIATRIRLVKSRERFAGERRRADGRIMAVTFNPLPMGGGIMTYTDVTETRNREARLVRSEESFRYRFHNLPLPQWIYSVKTLRLLEVNDPALSKYGYTQEEFLSMTLEDLQVPEEVDRLMQGPGPFPTTEQRHRCKDGSILEVDFYVRDVDFNGEPAQIALIIDNTARKQAESQTERIFDTSQDLIHVTDSYGKFVRVSPSATAVLGYRPEEMLSHLAGEFIHPEDLESPRRMMRGARHGHGGSSKFRCRYIHKDGHAVSLLWSGVWSESDRRYYFIGRDMTDHDRTEEQLRQSQRMEAIGQLTGGVAHDFNNILMVLLANVEALQEEEREPRLRQRIKLIGSAIERAADLTRQLLAFSRKQSLNPKRTNLNDLVTSTSKLLRRALGEHIEIDSTLMGGLWTVNVDRAQLETALVNLCVNARDAMPGGGKLSIETRNIVLDTDSVTEATDVVPGEYVMLCVTDTGSGMTPETRAKVFEPFFTTKGVGQGTGLGLSMVYGFIKQSKGHITVHGELGHGTAFKLYLPRSEGLQEDAAVRPAEPIPRGTERVLVVEDEQQVRASVVGQLQSLGYAVTQVPDGIAGLAAIAAAPQPYDLMLTDLVMPGALNGRELADEVARRWPGTKVVFMSGYSHDMLSGDRAPGPLLSKPFRKLELARVVRRVLDVTTGPDNMLPRAA